VPRPEQATVVQATTLHHLAAVRSVMEEAFMSGSEVSQRVVREEHLGDPDVAHYLVYAGPEAVACATVVRHDGMAGVWNVGTRRGFRRQGYATLLMQTVLHDLTAWGCTCSILMASPSGEPLYLKLGYRPIGRICYMGPPDDLTRWWGFA
jgi:predicted GNAT family acetyltransferase